MKKFTLYSLTVVLGVLLFSVLTPAFAANRTYEFNRSQQTIKSTQSNNYSSTYFTSNKTQYKLITTYLELKNKQGEIIGIASIVQMGKHVFVNVNASGLTPGKHGFHIHENPITNNDFATAGGHFNPGSKQHGHDNPNGAHLGDLPNLIADENGKIDQAFLLEGLSIERNVENSVLGRAFIIHEKEDDGKTDPAGNAGDRIAGGNIAR